MRAGAWEGDVDSGVNIGSCGLQQVQEKCQVTQGRYCGDHNLTLSQVTNRDKRPWKVEGRSVGKQHCALALSAGRITRSTSVG